MMLVMADRRERAKAVVDRVENVRDRVLDTMEGDAYLEFRVWLDRELRAVSVDVASLADDSAPASVN